MAEELTEPTPVEKELLDKQDAILTKLEETENKTQAQVG